MNESILAFLEANQTSNDLVPSFTALLSSYGFEKYALTHYFPSETSDYDLVAAPLLPWHFHFHQQGYDDIDTVGQTVKQGSSIEFWNLQDEFKQAEKPMQQMICDALDTGLSQGVSLLLQEYGGVQAILVLHHPQIREKIQADPQMLFTIQACAKLIFEKNQKQFYLPYKQILTDREREILRYAIHDTVEVIAKKIHRTPRTVTFHLNNAREKLQASSKAEAIYRAMQLRILD